MTPFLRRISCVFGPIVLLFSIYLSLSYVFPPGNNILIRSIIAFFSYGVSSLLFILFLPKKDFSRYAEVLLYSLNCSLMIVHIFFMMNLPEGEPAFDLFIFIISRILIVFSVIFFLFSLSSAFSGKSKFNYRPRNPI